MKARVLNPKHQASRNYAGRGISICKRWMEFENFLADMGERPEGLTLDRTDNNGNYEPGNCRWVSRKVQNNNWRHNIRITLGDVTHTLAEWAEITGFSKAALRHRYKSGWSAKRILSEPPQTKFRFGKLMEFKGEIVPLRILAKRFCINSRTVSTRMARGMSLEEALKKPVQARRNAGRLDAIVEQLTPQL